MKRLLRNLIIAETTAEAGELAAADVISAELGLSGIACRIDSWGRNRANLIAQIPVAELKSARRASDGTSRQEHWRDRPGAEAGFYLPAILMLLLLVRLNGNIRHFRASKVMAKSMAEVRLI